MSGRTKKGKDVLFNQQFFLKSNDLPNLNSNMAKIISKKLNKSLGKVRSTSKNKFNGQYSQTGSTIRTKENANSKDKILLRNNQNGILNIANMALKQWIVIQNSKLKIILLLLELKQ